MTETSRYPLLQRHGHWVRTHAHDKRIGRGDDWAGDAWTNRETGELQWTAVGKVPTCPKCNPKSVQ